MLRSNMLTVWWILLCKNYEKVLRVYLWHVTYLPIFVLSSQSIRLYFCYGWICLSISIFIVTIFLYPEYHFSNLINLDIASITSIFFKRIKERKKEKKTCVYTHTHIYIHVYIIHTYMLLCDIMYNICNLCEVCIYYLYIYVWSIHI